MKTELLHDLWGLFFPAVCPACGEQMAQKDGLICTACMLDIPLTGYWKQMDNPVAELFWGHLPLVNACSFMEYNTAGRYSSLIRGLKYRGQWHLGLRMGEWFGWEMRDSGLYGDVDVVVAVPLHFRRRLKRGYNQSEYIAQGLAKALCCKVDRHSVRRIVHNPSQVEQRPEDRWQNVEGIFAVRNANALAGKHILLVDDVLTTGATIISCGEAILRAVPTARLSIATLATVAR